MMAHSFDREEPLMAGGAKTSRLVSTRVISQSVSQSNELKAEILNRI